MTSDRPIEISVSSPHRGIVTVEMRVSKIEWEDATAYLASMSDVSRYKALANTLKVAEEAAMRASQLKSEFLASMSHEIRTPLNGLLGMVQILDQTELTSEQRSFLRTVHTSGEQLLHLINDILDLSKIEAGKLTFEIKPFGLDDLVRDTLSIHAHAANAKGLFLTSLFGPDVPEIICGDKIRLRQVLMNLIGNAVKFTNSGEVLVKVTTGVSSTDSQCVMGFEVIDTGIGIDKNKIGLLFQPFSQLHTGDKALGGTGLGLSICKRLVQLMGGELSILSKVGEGSTFRFDLSFSTAVGAVRKEPLCKVAVGILSTSPTRRDLLRQILLGGGFEVRLEPFSEGGEHPNDPKRGIGLIIADFLNGSPGCFSQGGRKRFERHANAC